MRERTNTEWQHNFWRTMELRSVFTVLALVLVLHDASRDGVAAQGDAFPQPKTSRFECRADGCCDEHQWCRFWAGIGECASNADWMDDNCKIACNRCPRRPVTRAPRTRAPRTRAPRTRAPTRTNADGSSEEERSAERALTPNQRCARIGKDVDADLPNILKRERLLVAREDVSGRRLINADEVNNSNRQFGCAPRLTDVDCRRNLCYHLSYRSVDGTCNNLARPLDGAAFMPLMRLMEAIYDNGVDAPIGTINENRPSAREASRFLLSSSEVVDNEAFNQMLMQWGQFISHDVTKTTQLLNGPCTSCQDVAGRCFNIPTTSADPRFGPQGCLRVSRSTPVCALSGAVREQYNENTAYIDGSMVYGSSMTDMHKFRNGNTGFLRVSRFNNQGGAVRQQYNENTAYINGSMVYGSSMTDMHKFRNGNTGFLRVSRFNNQVFMPFNQNQCFGPNSCNANFEAGDNRANLFVGLATLHTLLIREHNRLAFELERLNPSWDGERVFQEARKIVGAQLQAITYTEYLPKIMGTAQKTFLGNYSGYDPAIDPSIANQFTTATFRFGHGMIQEFLPRLDSSGRMIAAGGLAFSDGVLQSNKLLFDGGIDPVLRGLMTTPAKRPQRVGPSVTERMFGGTDLAALNIQRGRDHGLPSYNEWREFCGLKLARTFDDFGGEMLDQGVRDNVREGYQQPDNVDLYVGAMLEDPVADGMVGTTLACLMGEQFKRLREGDRFYYENPGVFTTGQLAELRKTTLAGLVCANGDSIRLVPRDAFDLAIGTNLVPCADIPRIDLTQWAQ